MMVFVGTLDLMVRGKFIDGIFHFVCQFLVTLIEKCGHRETTKCISAERGIIHLFCLFFFKNKFKKCIYAL